MTVCVCRRPVSTYLRSAVTLTLQWVQRKTPTPFCSAACRLAVPASRCSEPCRRDGGIDSSVRGGLLVLQHQSRLLTKFRHNDRATRSPSCRTGKGANSAEQEEQQSMLRAYNDSHDERVDYPRSRPWRNGLR